MKHKLDMVAYTYYPDIQELEDGAQKFKVILGYKDQLETHEILSQQQQQNT